MDEGQGRLQVPVRRKYLHSRYMRCSRPTPPMVSLPTTLLLLPPLGRFVLFHPILPVAPPQCQTRVPLQPLLGPLLTPAPPLVQRGRLMPYPTTLAICLDATPWPCDLGRLWPVQRAAGGPCSYSKYSSRTGRPCMLTHRTTPLVEGTCTGYVMGGF